MARTTWPPRGGFGALCRRARCALTLAVALSAHPERPWEPLFRNPADSRLLGYLHRRIARG